MPDESCRYCGGSLVNCSICPGCRKLTQRICNTCGSKTHEQVHINCLHVESIESRNGMKVSILTPLQRKGGLIRKGKLDSPHPLRNALLVFGIVCFLILGLAIANYLDLFQSQINESALMKNNSQFPSQNHDNLTYRSFENCLAYGSGQSMTITCPTEYGNVYSAVLNLPQRLASEFSNHVFSIRGISVVTYSDGSVALQYHNNMYKTNLLSN